MTRLRGAPSLPALETGVQFALVMGPTEGEFTDEQLEWAWQAYGPKLMADRRGFSQPGTRPWAWWRFELGEEPPDLRDEPIRLAQLGLLRDDEAAAIAERAAEARLRIDTDAERFGSGSRDRPGRRAVELHEAVKRALQARG